MGRKEENIKKAQALLHQKERIRNIGTAAHIEAISQMLIQLERLRHAAVGELLYER